MAPRKQSNPRFDAELRRLARRVMRQPWNRPGTDKTWVLRSHHSYQAFIREIETGTRGRPT